jgi:hypothetical protein
MCSPNAHKKIKFTDDNVDQLEKEFMLEHDRAMGYRTRLSPVYDIRLAAMEAFKPPPSVLPLMESFRAWIRKNQLARFDCFQEPGWDCLCYKCSTWRSNKEAEILMMESIMDERAQQQLLGTPSPALKDDQIMKDLDSVCPTISSAPINARFNSVSHFYTDMPMDDVLAPSTPAFSAVDFDAPPSDHGKEQAQQKWIRLMQMTPNQLRF